MSVVNELRRWFSAAIRRKGEDYFLGGRVKLTRQDDREIEAHVRGASRYTVRITRDAAGVHEMTCTCPFASSSGEHCKHIWAALLAAEQEGLLDLVNFDQEQSNTPSMPINPYRMIATGGPISSSIQTNGEPKWKRTLAGIRQRMTSRRGNGRQIIQWPDDRQLIYIVDVRRTQVGGNGLVLDLGTRRRQRSGGWGPIKRFQMPQAQWLATPDPLDRQIAQMLLGAHEAGGLYDSRENLRRFVLPQWSHHTLLRMVCDSERCFARYSPDDDQPEPLAWDDGRPWQFCLEVTRTETQRGYTAVATLRRDEQVMGAQEPALVLGDGLMIARGAVTQMEDFGAFELLAEIREAGGKLALRRQEVGDFLSALFSLPRLPRVELHPELEIRRLSEAPRPRLMLRPSPQQDEEPLLLGELGFDYGAWSVGANEPLSARYDVDRGEVMLRDPAAELAMLERLMQAGARVDWDESAGQVITLPQARLAPAVHALTDEGWRVEAEGKLYRAAGEFKLAVSSGIDWFDLTGSMDFGGQSVALPKLLQAIRRGETTVVLDDGTLGILPEQWLRTHAPLAHLGEEEGDVLRFGKAQIPLLDALLAAMPSARFDETFAAARQQLSDFAGIGEAPAPAGFVGELRPYQKQGLAWLQFLNRFGFGGCLADDMGLGKTIQVLALLEQRRDDGAGPSLVVVPRSLVFNWKQEAARFTPKLRVLDHSGIDRRREADHFGEFDLVLTTYGTLRRDALQFKDVEFDYVILDEAQAIKNASTASAKAARLLQGKHRLALSGTPIENHLGELWSVLEFLNPGMLGGASFFKDLTAPAADGDVSARQALARALRPFILRRTKAQVADDLPEKTEQTIFCELEPSQRQLYDELRDHYRASLLSKVDQLGIGKTRMAVLEALLRLRQAACHPGLIDKQRLTEPSAKFQTLTEQMAEILDEGHKVLVFSQFTSLLAILRPQLDAAGITYEYLDGKTTDRQQRVEHFQSDASCRVFLISLKAGGLGLNLTAADYVFLLDPWWNPAVEAQAIDRTHRIGQTRHVFAYRLIAKDTVEEKVLELQRHKRDLADAIINADNSLIAKLGREDLELLLS